MADKWHSLVSRVCESCGKSFRIQFQSAQRPRGGRYCSRSCNPRLKEVAANMVALSLGPKRASIDVICRGCGQGFTTKVKNIARGGGKFCSRACNLAYQPRTPPSQKHRRHNLFSNYGLTEADFDCMHISQRGRCAICGSLPDGPHGVLVVDHDHMTDCVRELLCGNCNTAVGLLRDDPIRAAKLTTYLLKHRRDAEDEADAIALLLWAIETAGGSR